MGSGEVRADGEARDPGILAFDEFEFDPGALTLRRGDELVALPGRPMQLLAVLCRHRDRFVSKSEILDLVWGDTAVSEASVFTALRELRRVLGDSGREQRFIQTRRGHGYRFAAAVEGREVFATARVRDDFVGRGPLLARLRAACEASRAGRGQIVLLAGEPGIGKTRVIEELVAGMPRVHRAWCWEGKGAPPYWPWIQLLRDLCRDEGGVSLAREAAGSPVATLLSEGDGTLPSAELLERPDARFRLFEAVWRLLERACRSAPRILVVEDLHWADASSLQVLEFVAHESHASGSLLLASYRDNEIRAPHPLAETLGRLRRRAQVTVEELEGLDEDAVASLIGRLSGAHAANEQVRDTRERTGGNPLWIRALFGLGGGVAGAALPLSRAPVRDVLEGLAGRLSAETRRLLECAAVLGTEAPLALLGQLARLGDAALRRAVAEAERAGFLRLDRGGRVRFVHALMQETFYQSVPVQRAASLHERAGRLLEALHREDPGPHLSEIAGHFDKAAAWGDAARALDYARRSGERAMRLLAFDEAAAHFARARAALDHLPAAGDLERCDLLLAEAEALARGGRLAASIACCRPAVEIARERGDGVRLARAAIGSVGRLLPMGVLEAGDADLLKEALLAAPEESRALRAELLLRLAAHASASAEPESAARLMQEGARLAAASGDAAVQALVIRTQAYDRAGGVDPVTRLEAAAEAFERADRTGDHEAAAMALFLGMTGRLVTGEVDQADRAARILQHRIDRQRLLQVEPFLLGYRATRALMAGRYDDAERLAIETAQLGTRVSSPVTTMYFGVPQLGELRRVQGRASEIVGLLVDVPERFPDQNGFIAPTALMLAEAGARDEARRLFRRAAGLGFDRLPRDANHLALLAMFAEGAAALGERDAARPLYDLLAPHAHWYASAGHAQAFMGPVPLFLGLLAGLAGWDERADAHFGMALEAAARLDVPPIEARTRLFWARALATRLRPDTARARALAGEARTSGEALGMHALVRAAHEIEHATPHEG